MVEVKVEIVEQGSPRQVMAELPKLTDSALAQTILEWHKKMLPLHFTLAAYSLYKIRKRAEKYERMKGKRGEIRPLIFSGGAEQMAKSGIRIIGSGGKEEGQITVPFYIERF